MLSGSHMIIYSSDAEADRTFFRDVLNYPFVDAGAGWLIFALPPAELAVHPAPESAPAPRSMQEMYLMCADLDAFIDDMTRRGVQCAEPSIQRWGRITRMTLPSGGSLGVYEPSHPSPLA